ncbi:MAG: type II secretion system F family protein [Candidatus Pacearchaeota archaeon]
MKFKKTHGIWIIISLALIGSSFFVGDRFSFLVMGVGILIGAAPFVFSAIKETKENAEKEDMFLEFSRNLVESVKTGTPINKSIINVKDKPYGVLSKHVKKLANQIYMGIPLNKALRTFSKDISNKTISRSLTLISQAERSGGEIGEILEAVTEAVSMAEKLKKERKAAISTLVVQGYIIFSVFIIIILVLQFQIIPLLGGISLDTGTTDAGIFGSGGAPIDQEEISSAFLYLLMVQGLFTGLVIGKLSEGNIKTGIKHSFILVLIAFMVSTGANILFGG